MQLSPSLCLSFFFFVLRGEKGVMLLLNGFYFKVQGSHQLEKF